MANIGTFTADKDGFTGTLRTLALNVKVKFVPNDKGSENAPDYRLLAANGLEVGAAWQKVSQAERPYLSPRPSWRGFSVCQDSGFARRRSVSAISSAELHSSARAILRIRASVGMCSPRSTFPWWERSTSAR